MSLTIDDLPGLIPGIAKNTHARFARFVEQADIEQELHAYLLTAPRTLVKWVEDGDEFRVMRALYGVARQFCEREKAARSGYEFDDVAWYSPAKLADLMPLALNPEWDGITGENETSEATGRASGSEGGTLLAMIVDIRRAVSAGRLPGSVGSYDIGTEAGRANLEALADRLGGEFPAAPGYGRGRRAMSNAKARAVTEQGYVA